MGDRRTRYELTVTYAVTRTGDIDILDEGVYAIEPYESPTDALGDLGHFIRQTGVRRPAMLTWRRLDAANRGALQRDRPTADDYK